MASLIDDTSLAGVNAQPIGSPLAPPGRVTAVEAARLCRLGYSLREVTRLEDPEQMFLVVSEPAQAQPSLSDFIVNEWGRR